MRKFTKEHNELEWLFPDMDLYGRTQSEYWFDFYEKRAEQLFNLAHEGKDVFTKDDLIDAFMKGASTSQQCTMSSVMNVTAKRRFLKKQVKEIIKEHKRLTELLDVMEFEID